jgi:hypothetical protein
VKPFAFLAAMGSCASVSGGTKVVPADAPTANPEKATAERKVLEEEMRQLEAERKRLEAQQEALAQEKAAWEEQRRKAKGEAASSLDVAAATSSDARPAQSADHSAAACLAKASEESRRKVFEARRAAEEQRHCTFTKNSDGSTTVESKWVGMLSGGFASVRNPQFSLELPTGGMTSVVLERTETSARQPEGLCLFVYRDTDGARALEFLSGNVIAKSRFHTGNKVSIELQLPATQGRRPLLLLPVQEHRGELGEFRLTALATEKKDQELRLVPSNKIITFKSRWAGRKMGGLKSPANPQFQIVVTRPVNVSFLVTRPDKELDGTCIFLCKGVPGQPNRAKR